jgi:outer membrane protein insertion porin family
VQGSHYFGLTDLFTIMLAGDIGYGDGYSGSKELPFYENFYAGGVNSVRGFRDNTLGPCETTLTSSVCEPLGGAFRTIFTGELIFPTPFIKRGDDSTQFSAFVDVGNVFKDFAAFDAGELRAAAGLSFKWQAPVGPIKVNIAYPLIKKSGDRTETLQFAFGNAF